MATPLSPKPADSPERPALTARRAAGVLLHLSSLPGPWGIGDLGPEAESFLSFLAAAGQSCWQFLPLGPTRPEHGHSPYMSPSAFAGNPLLLSPELLLEAGWLEPGELPTEPAFYQYLVRFPEVERCKQGLLRRAFARFQKKDGRDTDAFAAFCRQSPWLVDYARFESLSRRYPGKPWYAWPPELARRKPEALAAIDRELAEEILYHRFVQFLFAEQWRRFRARAADKGIVLIGDLPIYVACDSADVWAHPQAFALDPETLRPAAVAGVPPDFFSPTGQAWGNPLYRWEEADGRLNPAVMAWWQSRLQHTRKLVDIVRIDHFRGFEAYWEIPAGAENAAAGAWRPGPGRRFFDALAEIFRTLPVIAEDLGTITPAVERLRDEQGFAGMKVLQFAFDGRPDNPYLPWNFTTPNCVVYTGTHDNETCVGWYLDPAVPESAKAALRCAANSDGSAVHRDFIRLAYLSTAGLAIVPLQDILGFGSDCRMNRPGSNERNWAWRAAPRFLTPEVAADLAELTRFANRRPAERPAAAKEG